MVPRLFRRLTLATGGASVGLFACALVVTAWRMPAKIRGEGLAVADAAAAAEGGADGEVAAEPAASASADAAAPAARVPAPVRRPYNVVLITIDTLRHDLGFSGYARPVSPNIDALAERSSVYERMYAMASFTPKSLGPMLIGRYVSETYRDREHYTHFDANVFLAERIQAAGGRTLAAMCHHYFRWKTGFDQGFDVWDSSAVPEDSRDNAPTVTSETLTDAAIKLLSGPRAEDIPPPARVRPRRDAGAGDDDGGAARETDCFFAWFHYLDPHLPYVLHEGAPKFSTYPPKEGDPPIPPERALYDGEVGYTDKHVGRLLAHIEAQPWAADTAIILTADHGEAFGERGFWKHGRELWEPLVRVPFVLYVPGGQARRIATKRSHIDLAPTVLDLMGIAAVESLPGRSLLHDLRTASPEERDVYIDMPEGPFNEMRRAFITGPSPGLKLIEFPNNRRELFDLAEDPHEAKSLSGDRARLRDTVAALAEFRGRLHER